jgi:membrane fusion protein
MADEQTLFRNEAMQGASTNWLGRIVLVRPVSFAVLTAAASLVAALLLGFLFFGTYTKRVSLTGQLIPIQGVVKIYAPQAGVVAEKHVEEGQAVERGQTLYVLSSERLSSTQGETQLAVSKQVELRIASLRAELEQTRQVHTTELHGQRAKTGRLRDEAAELATLLRGQKQRVAIGADIVHRHRALLREGYISKDQVLAKQGEWLEQGARLQTLERERANLVQELATQQNILQAMPLKQANMLAQIQRALGSTEQALSENEAKRRVVVTAPEAGIASGVLAQVGHGVDGSRPLLSLIPGQAELHAHLYAPSRAIGFTQEGDTVLLRYQAFPFQKFGMHRGVVVSVSRVALPISELAFANGGGAIPGMDAAGAQELYYRIQVALARQSVQTYGVKRDLRAGMVVEAKVLQETRRLYEWVLDPLHTLRGDVGT